MKKLISALLVLVLLVLVPVSVHAQEITPDPDSYDYGSTSEYAESISLSGAAESSLADTGQSQTIGLIAGGVLIVLSIGTVVLLRQKRLAKR